MARSRLLRDRLSHLPLSRKRAPSGVIPEHWPRRVSCHPERPELIGKLISQTAEDVAARSTGHRYRDRPNPDKMPDGPIPDTGRRPSPPGQRLLGRAGGRSGDLVAAR
jgi:hypothetical protein